MPGLCFFDPGLFLVFDCLLPAQVHLHFVVYDERIRECSIQSAIARTDQISGVSSMIHLNASDWLLHS